MQHTIPEDFLWVSHVVLSLQEAEMQRLIADADDKPDMPVPNGVKLKFCCACGREHPVTEFYSDRSRSDGLKRYCKTVDVARRVSRAKRAREKARALAIHQSTK